MYQSLATVLIVVAYSSFALAEIHNHKGVQDMLPAVFGTYLKDRTDAKNWETANFSFGEIKGDHYWYMATVKLDDPDLEIYLLAAGYNGTPDSNLVDQIKKPMRKATYVNPVGDYEAEADKAYAKTEEDFVKKAKEAKMKCQYLGSVESIFSVYDGEKVIGTYLGVGFLGYQDSELPTLTQTIRSLEKDPFSKNKIAFEVYDFPQ